MAVAFVRQLGAESGVQLNPLRDNSETPAFGNDDQVFGAIIRATRGRIDRPFKVSRANIKRRLGAVEPIAKNKLNIGRVHIEEGVQNGAYEAVIMRLSSAASKLKWAKASVNDTQIEFAAEAEKPTEGFLVAVLHHECHNDGIKIAISAEAKAQDADQDFITLRVLDSAGIELYAFTGSLNPDARDDFGGTRFLPSVVSAQTDAIEVIVGDTAALQKSNDAYGLTPIGDQKEVVSDVLMCFEEGATTYTAEDLQRCCDALEQAPDDYAYITGAGTEDAALIPKLLRVAHNTNRQVRIGVPGSLKVDAAIKWIEQMNLASAKSAHLIHAFWAPFTSDDPTGVNGRGYYGCETLNIAMACARNAQKNAKGFAPKNYPIAGREHPVNRVRIIQTSRPTPQELSALAKAKINPVVFETYTGGGRYVFSDNLTCAPVENSLRKLISVADMATSIDEFVTRRAKDLLHLPMSIAVKRMTDTLRVLFADAESSGWTVPSADLDGQSATYVVQPNEQRPYDTMDVSYWVRYDGAVRAIHVTQTISG